MSIGSARSGFTAHMQPIYAAAGPARVAQHVVRSRTDVMPDRIHAGYAAVLNQVHLMQTDNNVQPVMGAVHIVRPPPMPHDKHFMVDMEGDINEGVKVLKQKGRRGPFGTSTGRSTVMDRSAHVTYRNRRGIYEITVRKGFSEQEIQLLLHKLRSHSMSTDAYIVIIKGKKRYRLGKLRQYDLQRLRLLVEECTQQYGSCGLELTGRGGVGSLFKPGTHSARFKNRAQRGVGLFA